MIVLLIALAMLPDSSSGSAVSQKQVSIAVFRAPDCPHCSSVERPELDRLSDKVGVWIGTKVYDIEDIENYKLLVNVEKELGDQDNEFPVVVVGKRLLGGNEEIEKGLEQAVKDAVSTGQTGMPEIITRLAATGASSNGIVPGMLVYAAFFSQGGCSNCDRVLASLRYLKSKYPSFEYRMFDTREAESARLFEALCERHRLNECDRRKNPGIFIGDSALLGEAVSERGIETAISRVLTAGTGKPWLMNQEEFAAAQRRLIARFNGLCAWTVVAAGFIDGINPCAFATIVFFIGYLAATKRSKRDMVIVGLAFASAVFATYLVIGLGLLGAMLRLRAYAVVSRGIDLAAGGAALVFGFMSIGDYLKARAGRLDEMTLVLPKFIKRRINLTISRQLGLRGIVVGAVLAGITVSVFELACTGQVYLPTITLITGDIMLKAKAISYLTLYNLLFVLPLLLILGVATLGMSSNGLGGLFRRNIAASKLALAGLFFAIGVVVLLNTWRH